MPDPAPLRDEYQPRTPERLVEILRAVDNPRSWQREAAALIAALPALIAERDQLRELNVEVSVRAHKWMEAHDKLKAGKDYEFPTPADVPTLRAERDQLREERDSKERVAVQAVSRLANAEDQLRYARDELDRLRARVEAMGNFDRNSTEPSKGDQ